MNLSIHERELTSAELKHVQDEFVRHDVEHGNNNSNRKRLTVIAMDGETFIGCASGLLSPNKVWFYVTDLFVEKAWRRNGIGRKLLQQLETRVWKTSAKHIWIMTAGYEGAYFYPKLGYEQFFELEEWYESGHSQLGFRKSAPPIGRQS